MQSQSFTLKLYRCVYLQMATYMEKEKESNGMFRRVSWGFENPTIRNSGLSLFDSTNMCEKWKQKD